jgi:hypothetical protein
MYSVPITTKVVGSNPVHGEVYSIPHYMIKLVSDLRQVGGFLHVLRFPPFLFHLWYLLIPFVVRLTLLLSFLYEVVVCHLVRYVLKQRFLMSMSLYI